MPHSALPPSHDLLFATTVKNNGTNALAGANQDTLTLSNVSLANAGQVYSVRVSNVYGVVTSAPALLTVNPAPRRARWIG